MSSYVLTSALNTTLADYLTTNTAQDITEVKTIKNDFVIDQNNSGELQFHLSSGSPPSNKITKVVAVEHASTSSPITLSLPSVKSGATSDQLVSLNAIQTLTGKTLTTPIISSITNGSAALTLPTSTGTIALTSDITSSSISGISSKYRLVNPHTTVNTFDGLLLTNINWSAITGASDGSYLFATVNSSSSTLVDRNIWYSTSHGVSWTKVVVGSGLNWSGICCSSDGSKLMAVVAETETDDTNGHAWYSSNSGQSWANQTPNGPGLNMSRNYRDVCCNSNGDKFTAIVNDGYIYTDVGVGTNTTGNGGNQKASQQKWYAIDCSSDGSKLAAVIGGSNSDAGNIWISTDSGDNWTQKIAGGGAKDWRDITMSADGKKLAAVVNGGNIWISSDSGSTWTEDSSVGTNKNWVSITSSDDGTNLTAAVYLSLIHI